MTIKSINEKREKKIEIDLTGPQGNAFCLLGYAKRYAQSLQYSEDAIKTMLDDMKSSDYEHLLEVFDENFGDYVILYR